MLYALHGKLVKKENLKLAIDVNGIVFEVIAPLSTIEKLPEEGYAKLFVELVIGEKSVKLYGFYTEDEKNLFNQLRKISKIGAQTAISILSNITVEEFYKAVEEQNKDLLMNIPGIGKKTALSIIVEIASKLPKTQESLPQIVVDTIETLKSLGFKEKEARKVALDTFENNRSITLELLIKESLKKLRKDVY